MKHFKAGSDLWLQQFKFDIIFTISFEAKLTWQEESNDESWLWINGEAREKKKASSYPDVLFLVDGEVGVKIDHLWCSVGWSGVPCNLSIKEQEKKWLSVMSTSLNKHTSDLLLVSLKHSYRTKHVHICTQLMTMSGNHDLKGHCCFSVCVCNVVHT